MASPEGKLYFSDLYPEVQPVSEDEQALQQPTPVINGAQLATPTYSIMRKVFERVINRD